MVVRQIDNAKTTYTDEAGDLELSNPGSKGECLPIITSIEVAALRQTGRRLDRVAPLTHLLPHVRLSPPSRSAWIA